MVGASPRASIALNLAARAHAFLRHRGYVTPEDVKAVGPDVLRHRIVLTYEAEAEEVTSEQIVRRVFAFGAGFLRKRRSRLLRRMGITWSGVRSQCSA